MTRLVVLDSGPLGLLSFSNATPRVVQCTRWLRGLIAAGFPIAVHEIADFEVRRELLRMHRTAGLRRLETLLADPGTEYLPITTPAMRLAADYWARARQHGRPTADPQALNCDVVLAAQASLAAGADDFVVATTNVRHLSLFVPAEEWWTIRPV